MQEFPIFLTFFLSVQNRCSKYHFPPAGWPTCCLPDGSIFTTLNFQYSKLLFFCIFFISMYSRYVSNATLLFFQITVKENTQQNSSLGNILLHRYDLLQTGHTKNIMSPFLCFVFHALWCFSSCQMWKWGCLIWCETLHGFVEKVLSAEGLKTVAIKNLMRCMPRIIK